MFAYLTTRLAPPSPQANYIDSKKLESCHIKRAAQHRTMKGLAAKGKTSVAWFYAIKLHLIINPYGQLCNFTITSGKTADNNPQLPQRLFKNLTGDFFGDKDYLTQLKAKLAEKGVQLITKVRSNMKKVMLSAEQKHYLKQRGLIETVFGWLSSLRAASSRY